MPGDADVDDSMTRVALSRWCQELMANGVLPPCFRCDVMYDDGADAGESLGAARPRS